jgi:hypothetical protein
MGGTGNTSNHKRQIATTGTGHIARTRGATDMCVKDDLSEPTPYENYVDSSKLAEGTTQTFLAGKSIWIESSILDSPTEPEHPPHILGFTNAMPYRQIAWATSWSSDLIAEGEGVVRSDDTTMQNLANTDGYVDGSQVMDAAKAEEELLKQSCTLVLLDGVNEVKSQKPGLNVTAVSASRPLGYPGADQPGVDRYYLEILSGTSVTYTAERRDTTQTPPEINPGCQLGFGHTKWEATKAGSWESGQKTQDGNEKFIVDEGFTTLSIETLLGLLGTHKSTEVKGKPTPTASGKEETEKQSVSNRIDTLLVALMYFYYMANPATIEVKATGCKGEKKSTLRVFPSKKVELKIDLSATIAKPDNKPEDKRTPSQKAEALYKAVEAVIAALSKVNDVVEFADRFAKLAAQPIKAEFMRGASLGLSVEFKPCTTTKVGRFGRLYTPSHVGLAWTLTLAASPLLGFSASLRISLINFIAPGLGESAASALRLAGVSCDLVFTAGISLNLSVAGGMNEYEEPTFDGIEVAVNPTFGVAIEIALGIDVIKVGVNFNGTLALKFTPSEKPTCRMQMEPKGEVVTEIFLTVFPDSWIQTTWTGKPEFLKLSWLGEKIDILPVS